MVVLLTQCIPLLMSDTHICRLFISRSTINSFMSQISDKKKKHVSNVLKGGILSYCINIKLPEKDLYHVKQKRVSYIVEVSFVAIDANVDIMSKVVNIMAIYLQMLKIQTTCRLKMFASLSIKSVMQCLEQFFKGIL